MSVGQTVTVSLDGGGLVVHRQLGEELGCAVGESVALGVEGRSALGRVDLLERYGDVWVLLGGDEVGAGG